MAVTVFLFILLLGGVAGKINTDIEGLIEHVQKQCEGENPTPQTITSCQNFANAFKEETEKGPGCTSPDDDSVEKTYKNTLSLLSPTSERDKTLLWSGRGMGEEADKQGSKTTLGMTEAGKSLYALHWNKTETSVDTLQWYFSKEYCHSYYPNGGCKYPLEYLYWYLASIKFAAQAEGEVEVYLTDENGTPYDENSIFRKYEVPNLNTRTVTKLKIQLFDVKDATSNTCEIPGLCVGGIWKGGVTCECVIAGTSKLAAGNYSVTGTPYWRPDGTCDSCMKLPSVMTIIIPILTLLLKS